VGVYGHRLRDKKVVGVFVRFRAPLQIRYQFYDVQLKTTATDYPVHTVEDAAKASYNSKAILGAFIRDEDIVKLISW
jgi:hypothetical protein